MSSPSGLLNIRSFVLPYDCASAAIEHLQYAGRAHRVEGVALFAGKQNGHDFEITHTIIPEQKAASLEDGLIYVVSGQELHRINVALYKADEQLAIQIHSHPTKAYHSETDDAFPIVNVIGGLSIVVPDFAVRGVDLNTWAVYRLSSFGTWDEVEKKEKSRLISITDAPEPDKTKRPWYRFF